MGVGKGERSSWKIFSSRDFSRWDTRSGERSHRGSSVGHRSRDGDDGRTTAHLLHQILSSLLPRVLTNTLAPSPTINTDVSFDRLPDVRGSLLFWSYLFLLRNDLMRRVVNLWSSSSPCHKTTASTLTKTKSIALLLPFSTGTPSKLARNRFLKWQLFFVRDLESKSHSTIKRPKMSTVNPSQTKKEQSPYYCPYLNRGATTLSTLFASTLLSWGHPWYTYTSEMFVPSSTMSETSSRERLWLVESELEQSEEEAAAWGGSVIPVGGTGWNPVGLGWPWW